MDSRQPVELGDGVRVVPLPDGGWQVRSPRLELPWRARTGKVTGSAVMWRDLPWEVVAREISGGGTRWSLQAWPENEAMRGVYRLDGSWISALVRQRITETRSGRLRWGLLPALPLLGSLPGDLQNRWHLEWGFPAVTATVVSALLELGAATFGVVHMLSGALGGGGLLPGSMSWLGPLAPLLLVESAVRLKHVAGNQEPIGSVVGLPLAVLAPRRRTDHQPQRPRVQRFDGEAGVLELDSPIHRRDWSAEGVLRYRDQPFELVRVERVGPGWRYHFGRTGPDGVRPTLRLLPAEGRVSGESHATGEIRGPGVFRVAVTTAVACLALGADQARWAAAIGVSPILLTVLGAGAQIVGAMTNFQTGLAGNSAFMVTLDLYILGEGLFRCLLLLISGRPVGSAVGFALRPFMEKALRR